MAPKKIDRRPLTFADRTAIIPRGPPGCPRDGDGGGHKNSPRRGHTKTIVRVRGSSPPARFALVRAAGRE